MTWQVPAKLYKNVTNQSVNECVSEHLLKVDENADKAYKQFRMERLIDKEKKLSITVTRQRLPTFRHRSTDSHQASPSSTITTKHIGAFTYRLHKREVTMKDILSHQKKHLLMVETEKCLTQEDYVFELVS